MNERISALAEQASFSAGHIVAEVIAPDYSGPEMYPLVDAFNALPREIREHILQSLNKNQQKFAELIVKEVFAKIDDERFEVYQPVKEAVMKHFGVE